MSLTEKVVVVTGAGSGIGRAISEGAAIDGAKVVGFGRSQDALEQTQRLCPDGFMSWVAGDVSSSEDVERLFGETLQRHGRVDILFNCAGVNPVGKFNELTQDAWVGAIETNLIGVALCCRAALRSMIETGHGRIITLGSRAAADAPPGWSAYSVSKAAVATLTRALAREFDAERYPDILINDLIPGITRTKMNDAGQDPKDVYPYARQLATLPAGGPRGQAFFRGQAIDIWEQPPRSWFQKLLGR